MPDDETREDAFHRTLDESVTETDNKSPDPFPGDRIGFRPGDDGVRCPVWLMASRQPPRFLVA